MMLSKPVALSRHTNQKALSSDELLLDPVLQASQRRLFNLRWKFEFIVVVLYSTGLTYFLNGFQF